MDVLNLNGENGGEVITDTAPHTGKWHAGQFLEDSVIATVAFRSGAVVNEAGYASVTMFKGEYIHGPIEGMTLTSGSIHMFNY